MPDLMQIALDDGLAPIPLEQVVFDYRLLSADKREFVLQKTDETQWLLKKTAENIIQIGQNLQVVSDTMPQGLFLPWLTSEFGMGKSTAYRFMQVAKRFKDEFPKLGNLSSSALYLLADPNTPQEAVDEAIQRAQNEKISHALAKKIIDAQEAIKTAQKAEAQARADAMAVQQLLLSTETEATTKIDALNNQIKVLRQEMESLVKPEVQIQEVEKEVIPQELTTRLATLQEQVNLLTIERDTETVRANGFAQRILQDRTEQKGKEEQERSRERWHALSTGFQMAVKSAFSQWPTPLDMQAFETGDWNEVDHIIEAAHLMIEECNKLRRRPSSMIVDAGE